MISFKSLTRQIEIGANCYLLQFGNKRIIIDSGMHPKEEGKDSLPDFSSIYDHDIDAAILSRYLKTRVWVLLYPSRVNTHWGSAALSLCFRFCLGLFVCVLCDPCCAHFRLLTPNNDDKLLQKKGQGAAECNLLLLRDLVYPSWIITYRAHTAKVAPELGTAAETAGGGGAAGACTVRGCGRVRRAAKRGAVQETVAADSRGGAGGFRGVGGMVC